MKVYNVEVDVAGNICHVCQALPWFPPPFAVALAS